MEKETSRDSMMMPIQVNTFALPRDDQLRLTYNVYKSSEETTGLISEKGRVIFSENFIESSNLGTLSDLCVRVLAKKYENTEFLSALKKDPLKLRLYYDSIDVNLPLEKCLLIDDDGYWRRVVLSKSEGKTFIKSYDWKAFGMSLKFVEVIESCLPEYWSIEEISNLALKIKDYVEEMHIRKLQSLKQRTFEQYIDSDAKDTLSTNLSEITQMEDTRMSKTPKEAEVRKKPKEKTKKFRPSLLFANSFGTEDENDDMNEQNNGTNLENLLAKKKEKILPEHCHHIDLSFLSLFENLETFTIEFQGPDLQREYNTRHFDFSQRDIECLASGMSSLSHLKIFRLRNSRMDEKKFEVIIESLSNLSNLEILDFGNDQLCDDCGTSIQMLFSNTMSLKSLELEDNYISVEVLSKLSEAIAQYKGTLDYLGLARNPLSHDGLHKLIMSVIGTRHIRNLCLTGVHMSQEAIICCLANELLRKHLVLQQLDLVAIHIGWRAGVELRKALESNLTIQYLDCRGCDLELEAELDVEVILKRNQYIVKNPYIGDNTKVEKAIDEWVNRVKNSILLEVLDRVDKQSFCRQQLPNESQCFHDSHLALKERHTFESNMTHFENDGNILDEHSNNNSLTSLQVPFVYDPNSFNQEEFLQHVYLPGPSERFYVFQDKKRRDVLKESTKG